MTVNKRLAEIQRFVNFIKPKNNVFKDLEFLSDQLSMLCALYIVAPIFIDGSQKLCLEHFESLFRRFLLKLDAVLKRPFADPTTYIIF